MSAWGLNTFADFAIVHEFVLQVIQMLFRNLDARPKGKIRKFRI